MNKMTRLKSLGALFALAGLIVFASSLVLMAANRAYVYTQTLTIEEEGSEESGNNYGVPFDLDGDAAMINALTGDGGRGSVYYYERVNGQWVEKQRIAKTNGILFGLPTFFDGNRALISNSVEGMWSEDPSWGAVYAYEKINGSWVEKQKLELSTPGGYFGRWLTLEGNTAFITYTDYFDFTDSEEAIKVYEYQNGQWVETQTIYPSDEVEGNPNSSGLIPLLNGDVAWIYDYSSESILGYEKINNLWTHTITLDDAAFRTEVNFWSAGDHLIAIENTEHGTQAVAYHRDNGVWTRQQSLPVDSTFDPELSYRWEWVDGEADRIVLGGRIGAADNRQLPQTHFFSIWEYQAGMWQETQRTNIVPQTSIEDYPYQLYTALSDDTVMASFLDEMVYVFNYFEPLETATPLSPTMTSVTPSSTPAAPTETPIPSTGTAIPPTETPIAPTSTSSPPETSTSLPPSATGSQPAPSVTPTLTLTSTPSSDNQTELLVNGGFEVNVDSNQSPDGWTLNHETGDKLKCNDGAEVIAYEGLCVFQFKGGDGENSKLQQDIDLTAYPVSAGDTLTLSGQIWAKGDVDSKVTLKVKYVSQPTAKLVVDVSSTGRQWTAFSELRPSLSVLVAETPTEITLQIKHASPSGKVRYDALSIIQQSNTRGDVLPLPSVP